MSASSDSRNELARAMANIATVEQGARIFCNPIIIIVIILIIIINMVLQPLQRKKSWLREKYVRRIHRKRVYVRQWQVQSDGRVHDGVGNQGEQAARTVPRNV